MMVDVLLGLQSYDARMPDYYKISIFILKHFDFQESTSSSLPIVALSELSSWADENGRAGRTLYSLFTA